MAFSAVERDTVLMKLKRAGKSPLADRFRWRPRSELRSGLALVTLWTLLVLQLAACTLNEDPAEFTMLGREPESLDPGLCSAQPGGRILSNAFEGLCSRDPATLAPVPGVARSWEINPNGTVYTFHLRSDARWSDGKRLRSEDFRYSWTRMLTPLTGAPYADLLYPIAGAEEFHRGKSTDPSSLGLSCPDDTTLVVRLSHPVAYWLDLCAYYPFFPVPSWVINAHGERWTRPEFIVSNGPYVVEKWELNRRVRLRSNPHYWDASSVALSVVDVLHGEDVNSNFNRYESGELDWVDSEGVPPSIVTRLSSRPDLHQGPYLNSYFLRFGLQEAPMDDVRVRKAFALAVDPQAITEHVTRGGQIPAHSLVPPGLPGYEEVQLEVYQPELARRLLAEAGYPEGKEFPPVTYLYNTSEAHRQIAVVLQQQWKKELGVKVKLRNMEWKAFMAKTRAVGFQIARGGWIGDYLDPNTFLSIWTSGNGNNRTGFASARYDSLLAEASNELEPVRRMHILHECEAMVTLEECVVLPIYYYVVTNLYDARKWKGLEPNLLNTVQLKYVYRSPEQS